MDEYAALKKVWVHLMLVIPACMGIYLFNGLSGGCAVTPCRENPVKVSVNKWRI